MENEVWKMKMLVASAGGDKAGVLFGMVKRLFLDDPSNTDWDVCAGISAGSIVSAFVCQTCKGNPHDFAQKLEHFEGKLLSKNFHPLVPWHHNSWLNMLSALLWHGSMYRSGVEHLVTANLGELKRELKAGAFNMDTSKYETLSTLKGVMASCAVPVAFPTVEINGMHYTDGSMAHWFPVHEMMDFIKKPGAKQVDLLLCYPLERENFFKTCNTPSKRKMVHSLYDTLNQRNWLRFDADCEILRGMGIQVREGLQYVPEFDLTLRIVSPKPAEYSDFNHITPTTMQRLIESGMKSVESQREQGVMIEGKI